MNYNKSSRSSGEKDYEDLFSSSSQSEYEDISSGRDLFADTKEEEFEDFDTGRAQDGPSDDLFDSPFFTQMQPSDEADNAENETIPVNTKPERKPYSYHYGNADDEPRTARNGDEIFEDIQSGRDRTPRPKKRRKHLGLKITLSVLAILLAAVLGLGFYSVGQVKAMLSAVNTKPLKENAYIEKSALRRSAEVQNILLVGTDARAGEDAEKTRSDTMLLLSIDHKHKQLKLTSFLRDMYVEIPDYRADKLNAAHSHGGTQLLVDTLESNFKIDIDGYVMITFDIFVNLIDSLGGIDVEITKKEAKYINSHDHMAPADVAAFPEKLTEGVQHFGGQQALWYSRIRYLDSDFMRTARQRKVLTALVQAAAKKKPEDLFAAAKACLPLLTTGYTGDELFDLAKSAPKLLTYQTVQEQIPAVNTYKSKRKRGQDCLVPDMKKNISLLHAFVFEEVKTEEQTDKAK